MKQIYILLIAIVLAPAVFAEGTQKKESLKEKFEKCLTTMEANIEKASRKVMVKEVETSLKSASTNTLVYEDKTHQLDSLLVERWNENTSQLEPAQLEKWTWNENDLGKSWELYDMDTLTGTWKANDKEEYTWDSNGNKIIHLDFDPLPNGNGWYENAVINNTYNESGQVTGYLLQYKDTLTNEWEDNLMGITEYDTDGKQILAQYSKVDSSGNWVYDYKEEYAYSNGNLSYMGYSTWDNTLYTWDTLFFGRTEYNTNGLLTLREKVFDSGFMHDKTEYSYDDEERMVEEIQSDWDYATGSYVYGTKQTYSYDESDNRTSWLEYEWNQTTNEWEGSYIINYEYDTAGNRIYRERLDIDSTNTFVLSWKNDYTYNSNNQLTYKISHQWENTDSIWIKSYQCNYEYDAYENTIYEDKLLWDSTANEWVFDYQENFEYDASGNTILQNHQGWDTTSSSLITEYQNDYTYDFETLYSEIVFPPEYEYWNISNLVYFDQYANMMLQKNSSEQKNNQLTTTEVFNFFYSQKITSGLVLSEQNELKVFPNPASSFIDVEIEDSLQPLTIELYNIQGQKMITKQLTDSKRLDVSGLYSGLYIYRLTQNNQIHSGKILIKHEN